MFLLPLIVFLTIILGTLYIVLKARTIYIQTTPEQKIFQNGHLPTTAPQGEYRGKVKNLDTSWIGKEFFPERSGGSNNFRENLEIVKKYPFKTYTGQGLMDSKQEVFKIDYAIPQNPFWLKYILDEIVETEPGKFLGKVHFHLHPSLNFTLGYFTLEK
jgi:hypothetical protein